MAFFSSSDKSSPAVQCQPVSVDIARVRDLYAIAKVVKWIEGLAWPP